MTHQADVVDDLRSQAAHAVFDHVRGCLTGKLSPVTPLRQTPVIDAR
jgi:hypothetical protein